MLPYLTAPHGWLCLRLARLAVSMAIGGRLRVLL